ncbi:MAG TPA: cation-efflux pump [Beijerinckiaceae bacterium]|nr:cation-efflux pump [Beijerinckiaceae bacterium]
MTDTARQTNAARKEWAARISVFASACIALLKLAAGLVSGSLALLSEAGHALIDLGATVLTWFAVKTGDKPADDEHHYGHGKIEAVAALAETGLLIALACYVLYEAIHRLRFGGEVPEITWPVLAVLVVSILVDFNRWMHLRKVAKETHSVALAADALHFSSDLVSSLMVLVGLGAVMAGFPKGDALAAIAVAIFILVAAFELGKRTVNTLIDAAPHGAQDQVVGILREITGVIDVRSVKVRPAGSTLFVEALVSVPRLLPLDRVQQIREAAADAITAAMPEAEATITVEPKAMDDESVLERVILIAARRRIPVHHVTVQTIGKRLSVSLDVEVDGRMSLAAAHQIATRLEAAIRAEFGPDTEVETHIEPLEAQGLVGIDVDEDERIELARMILDCAKQIDGLTHVHDLRVRRTDKGLVVTLHLRADPQASVADVHESVDRLEHLARAARPDIARIVTHAEPRKE